MRGDAHVRFGGRPEETDPEQSGHRASGRPNQINRSMRMLRCAGVRVCRCAPTQREVKCTASVRRTVIPSG